MKYLLSIFILSLILINNSNGQDLDDDFDGVTVEEEPYVIDENGYESPTPSDLQSVYLWEHFDDPKQFERKWVKSQAKKEDSDEEISKYDGEWAQEAATKYITLPGDLALVLKSKARHSAISAPLVRSFEFAMEKPLIVQYEVNFQEGQECGGAYIKLISRHSSTNDLKQFRDNTPYTIMFGPDKCGNDHKLHFIFRHENPKNGTTTEKHMQKKPQDRFDELFSDKKPHLYTLILKPDGDFNVLVDKRKVISGNMLDDFEPPVEPPKEIDDPKDIKPADWDEREKIPDPEATKPEDWDEDAPAQIDDPVAVKPDGWLDDTPPHISDPDAIKPEDWDNDIDGEWEAPLIDNPLCATAPGCGKWTAPKIPNPAYRGKWKPPLIENPNYKGKWRPKRIPNPDYFSDERPFLRLHPVTAVGFELWTMSNDILFDNILITDNELTADEIALKTWKVKKLQAEKDAKSYWGRVMRALNYQPGLWTLYAIWCLVPFAIYFKYLNSRKNMESVLTRLLVYADESPWLWAVYILVVGLPVMLILYCCCNFGNSTSARSNVNEGPASTSQFSQDNKNYEHYKKTDENIKDNENEKTEEDNDNGGETQEQNEDDQEEEEGEDDEEEAEIINNEQIPDAGDAPRRRKVRKE